MLITITQHPVFISFMLMQRIPFDLTTQQTRMHKIKARHNEHLKIYRLVPEKSKNSKSSIFIVFISDLEDVFVVRKKTKTKTNRNHEDLKETFFFFKFLTFFEGKISAFTLQFSVILKKQLLASSS